MAPLMVIYATIVGLIATTYYDFLTRFYSYAVMSHYYGYLGPLAAGLVVVYVALASRGAIAAPTTIGLGRVAGTTSLALLGLSLYAASSYAGPVSGLVTLSISLIILALGFALLAVGSAGLPVLSFLLLFLLVPLPPELYGAMAITASKWLCPVAAAAGSCETPTVLSEEAWLSIACGFEFVAGFLDMASTLPVLLLLLLINAEGGRLKRGITIVAAVFGVGAGWGLLRSLASSSISVGWEFPIAVLVLLLRSSLVAWIVVATAGYAAWRRGLLSGGRSSVRHSGVSIYAMVALAVAVYAVYGVLGKALPWEGGVHQPELKLAELFGEAGALLSIDAGGSVPRGLDIVSGEGVVYSAALSSGGTILRGYFVVGTGPLAYEALRLLPRVLGADVVSSVKLARGDLVVETVFYHGGDCNTVAVYAAAGVPGASDSVYAAFYAVPGNSAVVYTVARLTSSIRDVLGSALYTSWLQWLSIAVNIVVLASLALTVLLLTYRLWVKLGLHRGKESGGASYHGPR